MKVKWTNYRVKQRTFILIFVSIICLTIYQCIIIFGYEDEEKFLPYSALFLNFNVICLGILIFLSKYRDVKDSSYVIKKFFQETGDDFDPERDVDMIKEIEEQEADKHYTTSKEDLEDIITAS